MPSGTHHLRLELSLLPVFLVGLYLMELGWPELPIFAAAYLFSSLLLSPDLDLRSNSARRRWGVLGLIWVPYIKVFKHRGLSHNLLFGPLTRIGYLFLLGAIVIYALNYFGIRANIQIHLDKELSAMIGIGLYLPNVLHILYDYFNSRCKRPSRRRA